MVLSGYLFAKLLDGKTILYGHFFWNRFIRLAPLLALVILVVGLNKYFMGQNLLVYARNIAFGLIKPILPNGGWSLTVEFHFYLMLPALLLLAKGSRYALLIVLASALIFRVLIYLAIGEIQSFSYWTIIGRIDQFILGIVAFQFRHLISGKHLFAACVLLLFAVFYWWFDSLGGFYMSPDSVLQSSIWIYMPTLEGLAYGLLIAWYDNSFVHSTGRVSRFIALIGTCSYSIYLLHFFVVFELSAAINTYIADLSNIYLALFFSLLCFPLMLPVGYLSYRYFESWFLRFRSIYAVAGRTKTMTTSVTMT